jgi:hypothetical protein
VTSGHSLPTSGVVSYVRWSTTRRSRQSPGIRSAITCTGRQCGARQRAHLARHFMQCDLGYFDDETWPAGTDRESVRAESVTDVLGMNCHPCVRNGPSESGRGDWIRTSDPLRPRSRSCELLRCCATTIILKYLISKDLTHVIAGHRSHHIARWNPAGTRRDFAFAPETCCDPLFRAWIRAGKVASTSDTTRLAPAPSWPDDRSALRTSTRSQSAVRTASSPSTRGPWDLLAPLWGNRKQAHSNASWFKGDNAAVL